MNGPIAPSLDHQQKQDRNRDFCIKVLAIAVALLAVAIYYHDHEANTFQKQINDLKQKVEQLVK